VYTGDVKLVVRIGSEDSNAGKAVAGFRGAMIEEPRWAVRSDNARYPEAFKAESRARRLGESALHYLRHVYRCAKRAMQAFLRTSDRSPGC